MKFLEEYAFKFTQFYRYALIMVVDLRERMSKFVSRVSNMVIKE